MSRYGVSKYSGSWSEFGMYFGAIALFIAVLVGIWVGSSYFEAQAFNEATGKNVSTWNAMWIELRVQEQAAD